MTLQEILELLDTCVITTNVEPRHLDEDKVKVLLYKAFDTSTKSEKESV